MEIKDHEKEFHALIVPKPLQKYVLYGLHTSVGYHSMSRLYQSLIRQYCWKRLCKSMELFVKHYLQCQMTN